MAGAADIAVGPAGGEPSVGTAAGAVPLVPAFDLLRRLVGGAHESGRIRARRGRSGVAANVVGRSPVAVLRTPAFSAAVVTRSAGVHSKMSQSAANTWSERRSGVP